MALAYRHRSGNPFRNGILPYTRTCTIRVCWRIPNWANRSAIESNVMKWFPVFDSVDYLSRVSCALVDIFTLAIGSDGESLRTDAGESSRSVLTHLVPATVVTSFRALVNVWNLFKSFWVWIDFFSFFFSFFFFLNSLPTHSVADSFGW